MDLIKLGGVKIPCKGCQKRKLHCHSSCEKYTEYESEKKAWQDARFKYYLTSTWTATRRALHNKWTKAINDPWQNKR